MTETETEAAAPFNWPDAGLRPHRFAAIFRMLSGDEKESFEDDIAERGLKEKIRIFEDAILDGRNRYLALIDVGVFDPEFEEWHDRPELFEVFDGTPAEALDYVWSLNEQRRHDNATQRAMAAARYANLREVTIAEAAERFGVSERQVSSANKVIEHGTPELQQAADDGRLPGYLAEQVADLDEDEQREIAAARKGEASALAREKLQDPPPLSESGPVVKAMDVSILALFAAAVLEVGKAGKDIDLKTLDALARTHNLLADKDETFNLKREVTLAFEVARKRLNIGEDELMGESLYAVLAAGLSDDLDLLTADYRQALKGFDAALTRGDKDRAGELKLMMEAILWQANGKDRTGMGVGEGPTRVLAGVALPPGVVPMWGQTGTFAIEVDGLPAIVQLLGAMTLWGPELRFWPVQFGRPFPRGGWLQVRVNFATVEGDVESYARRIFAESVAHHATAKPSTQDSSPGMYFPERVYRMGVTHELERVERGVLLDAGKWPELPKWDSTGTSLNSWPATEKECREKVLAWRVRPSRSFPKPRHLATHILVLDTSAHLAPIADFPTSGAYVFENNGTWRLVDDATDPGSDAVAARLMAGGAVPDRSAYLAALAALTEPRGKLHQSTAADAIKAGVEAGVPRAQMAEDLGHPIGTIQTWTARLQLTDPARLQEPDPKLAERNRARAKPQAAE